MRGSEKEERKSKAEGKRKEKKERKRLENGKDYG